MVIKNKKAYMKTLEVAIALILTFAFILYILPVPQTNIDTYTKDTLINLMGNEEFKIQAINLTGCVYKGENNTLSITLDNSLSSYQNYALCPQGATPSLPRKRVNVESLYLTGNITDEAQKIIKLYYWD